jgi:hypothetical protein
MIPYSEPQDFPESFEEHDLDKVVWEATMAERAYIDTTHYMALFR